MKPKRKHRHTQARSGDETSQIQELLREHNRGKKNNRQHEKHENKQERDNNSENQNKATQARSFTLPPPKESEALCRETAHEATEHKTGKQQQRGEGGPSTSRDHLYTAFRREDSDCKSSTETGQQKESGENEIPLHSPPGTGDTRKNSPHPRMQGVPRAAPPASR